MDGYLIDSGLILEFDRYLRRQERADRTAEKYLRDVRAFASWAADRRVTKELVIAWKESLSAGGYAPATINSMLAALHCFFAFANWENCRVKYLRVQRQLFRQPDRELTREDFSRLIDAARRLGRERLVLLMETICATGIRVSEVKYITLAAAEKGRAEISLKGKIRTVLLPSKLCHKLVKYAKKQKIASGEIFCTRSGKSLDRKQIWAEMKSICDAAGVEAGKVFPHNLRHLFAQVFYRSCRDVAKLADVLGHSSIETTRIYLVSTGAEHARELERLELVS